MAEAPTGSKQDGVSRGGAADAGVPSAQPAAQPEARTPQTAAPLSTGLPAADELDAVLATARRVLRRAALLEGAAALLAGAVLGLFVAVVLSAVVPFTAGARVVLLGLAAVSALVPAAVVWQVRLRPLAHGLVLAGALENALHRRGVAVVDAVRSAVELRAQLQPARAALHPGQLGSRALVDAHLRSTVELLNTGGALRSLGAVALERAVPTLLSLGLALLVAGAFAASRPQVVRERLARLFDDTAAATAIAAHEAELLPLVTNLQLTLRFPTYMNARDEVITGSTGDLTAPPGTEVVVEGRADRPIGAAALRVGTDGAIPAKAGDGAPAADATAVPADIAAEVTGERAIRAAFTVTGNGTYRFVLSPRSGGELLDPVAHKVALTVDAVPAVTLLEPAVDADERHPVQLDDDINVRFSATDDHGVTLGRVVVKRQGSARPPYTKTLLEAPGLAEVKGAGSFRVSDTGARPGERLSVYVEALDTDTVTGPKAGRSATRVLVVYSQRDQHRQLVERLAAVLARMTDALADELEAPLDQKPLDPRERSVDINEATRVVTRHEGIRQRHDALLASISDALAVLAQDRVAPPAVRRALANLRVDEEAALTGKKVALRDLRIRTQQGHVPPPSMRAFLDAAQRTVRQLEKDALYLDDLLAQERVNEARTLAADVQKAQEDLRELIAEYKKNGDPAVRDALLEEIRRMKEQLQELAARLADVQRDIPDEYLNEEAFKGDALADSAKDLDQLVEEGKLDEAADALDKMIEQTKKLSGELDKTSEDVGGDQYKELRDKLDRFADDLSALEKGETEQVQESERLLDKIAREDRAKNKAKVDAALKEVRAKLQQAVEALEKPSDDALFLSEKEDRALALARAKETQQALDGASLDEAMMAADEAATSAANAAASIADRTRGRFGARDKETLQAKAAMDQASPLLDEVKKRLAEVLPNPQKLLSAEDKKRMERSADRMQQLQEGVDRLKKTMQEIGQEAPVFGPEHHAGLEEAKQAMEEARGALERKDPRGARAAQQRAQERLAQLRKALEEGKGQSGSGGMPQPLPRGGSPGGEPNDRGDGRGKRSEDVKIPDGSGFKVPDAYRKDILDAMKEAVPESWQDDVKRYYEQLIK